MEQPVNVKKRLAIVFGGQSTEHEVSLRSSINVIKAVDRQKYELTLIGVDKRGRWLLCDEAGYLLNPDDPARVKLAPSTHYLAVAPGHNAGPAETAPRVLREPRTRPCVVSRVQ